ncbi:MAG: hypothetical protein ACFFCL_16585, partial [Promethearchaeota archaeon]
EEPLKEEPFVREEVITIPSEEEVPEEKEAAEAPTPIILSKQFDAILNKMENMTGTEISLALERFQNDYVKMHGYNSVLKNIHNASADLKTNPEVLSRPEREELKLSMKIWRQKLNL